MLWIGCQWKALPKDLPPKSTVHEWIDAHPTTTLWSLTWADHRVGSSTDRRVDRYQLTEACGWEYTHYAI